VLSIKVNETTSHIKVESVVVVGGGDSVLVVLVVVVESVVVELEYKIILLQY